MDVQVEVKLQICIEKTESGYIAFCEPLDIYAEGSSKRKAEANIREALSLFLETCLEMGTFNEVLTSSGFQKTVVRKKKNMIECENIKVPVQLLVANHVQQAHSH